MNRNAVRMIFLFAMLLLSLAAAASAGVDGDMLDQSQTAANPSYPLCALQ